jgi:hypothetical protein
MSTVVKLPADDPLFALCPGLDLRRDETDGELVANSRDVAKYFGRRHRRLMRHIMQEMWHAPMRPDRTRLFRPRDNSFDLTADALVCIVSTRWGKRGNDFVHGWIDWMCAERKRLGVPFPDIWGALGIKGEDLRAFTADGQRCCDECHLPEPAGPMLHDELWASIAKPHAVLCFSCTEKRLGRSLVQGDLTVCAFNAGWIDFDGADVMALQFAQGRRVLPTTPAE